MSKSASGKVKKIVGEKGYGFITLDSNDTDVFFHHSGLENVKIEDLNVGDSVTCEVVDGDKGKKKAVNVCLVD